MQFGRVLDATLMIDKDTGRPRGFGFVTFDSETAVENALAEPDLRILDKPVCRNFSCLSFSKELIVSNVCRLKLKKLNHGETSKTDSLMITMVETTFETTITTIIIKVAFVIVDIVQIVMIAITMTILTITLMLNKV